MPKVAIVCDSTCDLGPRWLADHDVTMVPLKVLFGDESFLDWIDLEPDEFYKRLVAAPALPKTSQPSPADFSAAFDRLASKGATEIVSIHLSSALSGTYASALLASQESSIPVRVVDTKHVTQATGLVVKAAIRARDAGLDGAAIEAVAVSTTEATKMFFVLDTLDYLVKGGRAGKAAGLAASVLNIKPVLTFNSDGIIEPFKKVKGTRKALTELASHVAEISAGAKIRLCVFHAVAPELVDELQQALDASGTDYEFDSVGLVGSVIGTYAGPRAVGLAFHPVE